LKRKDAKDVKARSDHLLLPASRLRFVALVPSLRVFALNLLIFFAAPAT